MGGRAAMGGGSRTAGRYYYTKGNFCPPLIFLPPLHSPVIGLIFVPNLYFYVNRKGPPALRRSEKEGGRKPPKPSRIHKPHNTKYYTKCFPRYKRQTCS